MRCRRKFLTVLAGLLLVSPALSAAEKITYKGNPGSKVYHKPGCRYYNSKGNTVKFSSHSAAKNSGYRPCKICKPKPEQARKK